MREVMRDLHGRSHGSVEEGTAVDPRGGHVVLCDDHERDDKQRTDVPRRYVGEVKTIVGTIR